eukprot:13371974-Heterocapsa_arctica.AAC.1
MDLVVYLENKLRAPEIAAEITAQQEEKGDTPISSNEFHAAIDMLKDKINTLTDTSSKIMQEHLEDIARTKNIVKELVDTLRATARPEEVLNAAPGDTAQEKEEQRIRELKKAIEEQIRRDWDNQRDR